MRSSLWHPLRLGRHALLLSVLASGGALGAPTWYVVPGGAGAMDGGSWYSAFPTVTRALQVAASGDAVLVGLGTYHERITLKPGVTLLGGWIWWTGQPPFPAPFTSVLDGDAGGPVVTVAPGARTDTQMLWFTITNGTGLAKDERTTRGGGLYIEDASPTISANHITGNVADVGGGIYLKDCSANIEGNVIDGNRARRSGGGIACEGSSRRPLLLTANSIQRNRAPRGGGIYAAGGSAPIIVNNILEANTAYYGGSGAFLTGGSLLNNTILKGEGASPGAVSVAAPGPVVVANNIIVRNASGIHVSGDVAPSIHHNDVFANASGNYVGIADQTGVNRNISREPALSDPAGNNYDPILGSPCVDAGDSGAISGVTAAYGGDARIQGEAVDIGAGEAATPASAAAIRVKPDGNDALSGDSWEEAKATLQAAVDAAAPAGKEVWVAAGTYYQKVSVYGVNVALYGGFTPSATRRSDRDAAANPTILDGTGQGDSVIKLRTSAFGTVDSRTVVDGFVIRNGTGHVVLDLSAHGGGILCTDASPTITNNMIELNRLTNSAEDLGGAIYTSGGAPYIACNRIRQNRAPRGSGIYAYQGVPAIRYNDIEENVAEPGINYYVNRGCVHLVRAVAMVEDNNLSWNTGEDVAGIYADDGIALIRSNRLTDNGGLQIIGDADLQILNNILTYTTTFQYVGGNQHIGILGERGKSTLIAGNVMRRKGSCYVAHAIYSEGVDVKIVNNTFVDVALSAIFIYPPRNRPAVQKVRVTGNIFDGADFGVWKEGSWIVQDVVLSHNCFHGVRVQIYAGPTPGVGDIVADPRLVDSWGGDYHLRFNSPCVDAGDDAAIESGWKDRDGQARIIGDHVDIGADEVDPAWDTGIGGVIAALRIAGGLEVGGRVEKLRLDVVNNGSSWYCVDLMDAVCLLRMEAGLE